MKNVIIIGAGLAGWSVVDAIRSLDKEIPITLISADNADRYHKPMLSNSISQNKSADSLIRADGQAASETAGITLVNNAKVVDIKDNTVITDQYQSYPFSHLVLAMGAEPIYPAMLPKSDKIFDVNHLSGFRNLQNALTDKKHLVILGAGMVGVELAEDLAVAGHQVTLIDNNAYPLAGILPPVAGERLGGALANLGVQFFQAKLSQVLDGQDTLQLSFDGGTILTAERLVIATGLKVDDGLPKALGLEFEDRLGILLNDDLTTNQPNIYAIGDCVAIGGRPCRFVAPHRPQATAIAHAILELPYEYKHINPMIRLKNKSVLMQATGIPNGRADGWQITSDEGGKLVLEQTTDGVVVATVSLTQK